MQPAVFAAPQCVHHHQRGAAAVLALVPLLPPLPPAPSLPLRPATMPLTLAAAVLLAPRPAAPRHLLVHGRRDRLAVDLDDQHVAVARGQGAFAHVNISRPCQTQDPLLDRRGRRRGPEEHPPEPAGDLEAHPRGQPAEPADDQRAVGVTRQAQRHVQGVHARPAAVPRHEESPDIGDRSTTGLESPPGGRVRHAIAAGPPSRRVEPIVVRLEEELDQQAPQRPQQPQQRRLELEERRGPLVIDAVRHDLVEPLTSLRRRSSTVGGQGTAGGLL